MAISTARPGSGPASLLRGRSAWAVVAVFAVSALVYWQSAVALGRVASPEDAYFDRLADSFLKGRLDLVAPPSKHDLTQYAGRWYVPFPPLPALLLIPWVAVQGVASVNTVAFSVAVGASNVALAFVLLAALSRRGWVALGLGDRLWLTALWGVGSVHWYMSTLGSVWFVSQLCTVTFMLLAAILATTRRGPLLSGLALAAAMWARPLVVLALPFVAVLGALDDEGRLDRRRLLNWVLIALVPIGLGALALLAYNAARFGDPFDFGYLTQNVAREVRSDLRTYGQFSLHYVSRNLWAMWAALPVIDKQGRLVPVIEGMSLLLTTPAMLVALRARTPRPLVLAGFVSILLLAVPLVTYYNTGWWQFGYRFSLDFMTPLFVLIAIGARARAGWLLRAGIAVGVVVNAWGTWWFLNPIFFR